MAPKIVSLFTTKNVSKIPVHTGLLFKKTFRCHFRCDFRCNFFPIELGPCTPQRRLFLVAEVIGDRLVSDRLFSDEPLLLRVDRGHRRQVVLAVVDDETLEPDALSVDVLEAYGQHASPERVAYQEVVRVDCGCS